jgi:hypothetical protein
MKVTVARATATRRAVGNCYGVTVFERILSFLTIYNNKLKDFYFFFAHIRLSDSLKWMTYIETSINEFNLNF